VVEPGGERVELRLPILAVPIEPYSGLENRARIETTTADPAGALLFHETGPNEDLDVARHRLERDVEWRRQFRDEQILAIEPRQHGAPHRIGKSSEHAVERRFRRLGQIIRRRNGQHPEQDSQSFD
jgi:hypothetical protein